MSNTYIPGSLLRTLPRHQSRTGYSCRRPKYSSDENGSRFCVTCDAMLARGDFARPVPEVRYDRCGTNADGCGGRYAGLPESEKYALASAISALIDLRTLWGVRADAEAGLIEDEGWR